MVVQTKTPIDLLALPDKERLVAEYGGRGLNEVRTPAFVIDRKVFADNCAKMHTRAKDWDASFRAHLKTHKVCCELDLRVISSDTSGDGGGLEVADGIKRGQDIRSGRVDPHGGMERCEGWPIQGRHYSGCEQLQRRARRC